LKPGWRRRKKIKKRKSPWILRKKELQLKHLRRKKMQKKKLPSQKTKMPCFSSRSRKPRKNVVEKRQKK